MYDVIIIGGGVIGAAVARRLARCPLKVAVLEAQNDVANGTTKANSAIIHAGYDPEPGTLMARLNVEGNRMMGPLCEELDVPFRRTGSLVLAFGADQQPRLEELYRRGTANGVPGLRLLSGNEARELEPNLSQEVTGALLAPSAGIVDPWGLALALLENAVTNGVELFRRCPVTAVKADGDAFVLTTPQGDFAARYVINAAGVDADKVRALLESPDYTVHPNRGEYYLLDKTEGKQVSRVIFQCPGPEGKGVLVAPTVHGNLLVGPNAEAVEDRRDLGNTADALDFVRRRALQSVPGLNLRQNIRNFSGIRANTDRGDFVIETSPSHPHWLDLAGICSPGLSSAPAIADYAARLLAEQGLPLEEKPDFQPRRQAVPRFRELNAEQRAELIQKDPRFGRVICRCETVTEGEIVAALHSPVPACSINGIKRRCNAGMGRCQGGFCGPRVQEIIARELGVPMTDVLMDQDGTWVLACETKTGKEEG